MHADRPSIIRGIALSEEPGLGPLTLPGFLRAVTTRYAEREALVLRSAEGVVRWRYTELWDRTFEIARALIASGLGKNGRVGILMSNRPEWIASFFGVGLAGGVAVALSTFSTAPELDYLLQSSALSILLFERSVAKKDFAALLCELEPKLGVAGTEPLASTRYPFLRQLVAVDGKGRVQAGETWPEFLARGNAVPPALVDATASTVMPSDPAALFFSSGTTNRPKGIFNAHKGVAIQCWRWPRIFGLKDDVRSWTANSFMWSGNFAVTLGGTLAAGGTIVLQKIFDPEEALELFQSERVNWPYAWPHQWAQLEAARSWSTVDLGSLRYVDAKGPAARHPTFRAPHWLDPAATYGNTETFTISTAFSNATPADIAGDSHGEALPGNVVKIVNPKTGAVVPRGEHGEIAVKGPTLMLGYLGIPLSETLDEDGFFRTGDGGFIDAEDRLHFDGRLSDIVKTGGANVSPVEVDSILVSCPGVKVAKTVGVPHATLGELLVSCVVPHEGSGLEEATVREFLRQHLASYKVPRRVLFVSETDLPLTGSSKIKPSEVRELVVKRLNA